VPGCQKIKKGELDQYGPEHLEVLPFDTTGLERVKLFSVCVCVQPPAVRLIMYSVISVCNHFCKHDVLKTNS